MNIRLDLHTHSAASPDGRMSLSELVSAARAAGLNGIAVTDHDATLTDAPSYDDFLIIPGCEFSTEFGHLLGLFLRCPIEKLSFARTIRAIHEQGGLAVLAHPFERSRDASRIAPLAPLLDGAEVWNGRAERKIRDANALAQAFAEAHNLRRFAGSDAHLPEEVGNGIVTVDAPSLSPAAVKAALLNRPVEIAGRRGRAVCVAKSQYTKLKKTGAGPGARLRWLLFAGKCAAEDLRDGRLWEAGGERANTDMR